MAQLVRECIWRMETLPWDLAGLQVQVTVMASYGIISLAKKLIHNCLSRLRSINEYLVFDWSGKGLRLRQSPSATGVGNSGAHTTVGVAVGAPASTWPGSRRLLTMAHSSYLVHRNPAVWLGALPFNSSSLSICHLCVCVCLRAHVCAHTSATRWDQEPQHTTNTDLRQRWDDVILMSDVLRCRRLQWLGHVAQMPAIRLPKKLLFGWLSHSRPAQESASGGKTGSRLT